MYCFLFGLIYVWWLMHLCPAWSYISNSALIFWNVYICGLGVNHGNMGGLLTVCTIAHITIKPLKPWQTLCALLLSTKKHFFFFFFMLPLSWRLCQSHLATHCKKMLYILQKTKRTCFLELFQKHQIVLL